MEELRQSTVDAVVVGPLLDASGNPVTTATLSDFSILKDSGADLGSATVLTGATVSHIDEGYYKIIWTTGNTDTLGRLYLITNNSSYSMAPGVYMVILASLFDAKYVTAPGAQGGLPVCNSSGNVPVDLQTIKTQTVTAAAGVTFPASIGTSTLTQAQVTGGAYALNSSSFAFDAALDFTTTQKAATLARVTLTDTATTTGGIGSGGITSSSFAAGAIDAAAIAADAIGSSELAASAVTEIQNGLSTLDANAVATACATALTTAAAESYRSTGSTGSPVQLLYEIIAHLGEHVISGTTKTTKRLDGSTTAKTYTLNDATTPTGITEAT